MLRHVGTRYLLFGHPLSRSLVYRMKAHALILALSCSPVESTFLEWLMCKPASSHASPAVHAVQERSRRHYLDSVVAHVANHTNSLASKHASNSSAKTSQPKTSQPLNTAPAVADDAHHHNHAKLATKHAPSPPPPPPPPLVRAISSSVQPHRPALAPNPNLPGEPCVLPLLVARTSRCCMCFPAFTLSNGSTLPKGTNMGDAGRYGCYQGEPSTSSQASPWPVIWTDQRCAGSFTCSNGNRVLCGSSKGYGRTNCSCAPLPPAAPPHPMHPPRPLRPQRHLPPPPSPSPSPRPAPAIAKVSAKMLDGISQPPSPPPTTSDDTSATSSASSRTRGGANHGTSSPADASATPRRDPAPPAPPAPSSPPDSCWIYMYQPSGCGPSGSWRRDAWGEAHPQYGGALGCAKRELDVGRRCGASNVRTHYVAAASAASAETVATTVAVGSPNATAATSGAMPSDGSSGNGEVADCKPFCSNLLGRADMRGSVSHWCKCRACAGVSPSSLRLAEGEVCRAGASTRSG